MINSAEMQVEGYIIPKPKVSIMDRGVVIPTYSDSEYTGL